MPSRQILATLFGSLGNTRWSLTRSGRISVWFVKVAPGPDEADYLFHNFDFNETTLSGGQQAQATAESNSEFVKPPTPPITEGSGPTTVLEAQGNHLCINDMYRTAYSFRIRPETGEVLTWASRHVVKGPKKDQDIVNCYQRLE
ncbi:hypothetical protein N7533_012820 [Penicillium manginii]|uniref:uncharacterized protein n=1 Tax=Penicillium manginii TaxID=203109 RepID=UPI00254954AD|nr:uncharacterized protein N7533_012820 [Penicillium manginii]KAJ5740036.1 hypothetical protein N7533_012820 [Penicillium manginii]